MVQLTDKGHWAVQVPDGAKLLHTEVDFDGKSYLAYKFKEDELLNEYELTYLDIGSWQYLFTTKGCTEEQLRLMDNVLLTIYFTRQDSLQSLLRSKGCDINKNWAIIQKQ